MSNTNMPEPITLYDISRKLPEGASASELPWSPNVFKTRIALNVKGIPFKIVYLKLTELNSTLSALGIEPNPSSLNPYAYSCPAIHDPNTDRKIMDSQKILAYLEEQYPELPTLFPPHTRTLQVALGASLFPRLFGAMLGSCVELHDTLHDEDKAYFRSTRESLFKNTLEGLQLSDEKLAAFEQALGDIAQWLGNDSYFTGDIPSNFDANLCASLLTMTRMGGKAGKIIAEASDGRLKRYLADMEQFTGDSRVR